MAKIADILACYAMSHSSFDTVFKLFGQVVTQVRIMRKQCTGG